MDHFRYKPDKDKIEKIKMDHTPMAKEPVVYT